MAAMPFPCNGHLLRCVKIPSFVNTGATITVIVTGLKEFNLLFLIRIITAVGECSELCAIIGF